MDQKFKKFCMDYLLYVNISCPYLIVVMLTSSFHLVSQSVLFTVLFKFPANKTTT